MGYDEDIAGDVAREGWSRVVIRDAKPCFVYSVGLMYTFKHPELIIFGLPDDGRWVLVAMVEQIRNGKSFAAAGKYESVLERGQVATRPVHKSQHPLYLGFAMGYCTSRGDLGGLRAIQVYWPDRAGLFPFERGCDEAVYFAQRRLDQPVMPDEIEEFERFMGTPG